MILNTKLLNQYFILSNNHNILNNINKVDDIIISGKHIQVLTKSILDSLQKGYIEEVNFVIENENELFEYIGQFNSINCKTYRLFFANEYEYTLFIFAASVLFLTSFGNDMLQIMKDLPDEFKKYLSELTIHKINGYVDSNDPRGLLFYLCKTYNLPYDEILNKQIIQYQYTEPAINQQWQEKYKEQKQPIMFWFYNSMIGKALFVVLFTPKCRYKTEKGGCAGCNLPTVSSKDNLINNSDVESQIDNVLINGLSISEKSSIRELMLSNNGSILDDKTISIESLSYCVQQAVENLPRLKKIIFETRIDNYTNIYQLHILENLVKRFNSSITLELAIGFEIFDDFLRNGYYRKGLEKKVLEEKIQILSQYDVSLKVYMMFKAVPDELMDLESAIQDLNNASEYFSKLSEQYNVKINLHISPTYLAPGTQLYKDYKNKKYSPPSIEDIDKMFHALVVRKNLSYYISMNNEGLDDDEIKTKNFEKYIVLKSQIYKFNVDNFL